MRGFFIKGLTLLGLISCAFWLVRVSPAQAGPQAQIPTGSIPTVTGTPVGAIVVVIQNEQGFVNLRSGPSTTGYDIVGVLTVGSQAPALGRTPGGQWIQVAYPGVPGGVAWVWKDLVELRGTVPVIEPPPTPTPKVTPTIDPTLAAQFLVEVPATRPPTFTAPPPINIPTYAAEKVNTAPAGVPMALVIIGMAAVGLFGTVISFLGGRR